MSNVIKFPSALSSDPEKDVAEKIGNMEIKVTNEVTIRSVRDRYIHLIVDGNKVGDDKLSHVHRALLGVIYGLETCVRELEAKVAQTTPEVKCPTEDSNPEEFPFTADDVRVGDFCYADPFEKGKSEFGRITKIDREAGLAYALLSGSDACGPDGYTFHGDIPVEKDGTHWKFTSF